MAKAVLQTWTQACGHQLRVLLEPQFVSDPRREAQAILKAATERIGASRRGRERPSSSATPSLLPQSRSVVSGQLPAAASAQDLVAVDSAVERAHARMDAADGRSFDGGAGAGAAAASTAIALPSALSLPALGEPEGLPASGGPAAINILALLQEHAGGAYARQSPCCAAADLESSVPLSMLFNRNIRAFCRCAGVLRKLQKPFVSSLQIAYLVAASQCSR